MASPDGKKEGGRVTPVSAGVISRIVGAAQGAWNGWFGPGQPQAPTAPKDVAGRAMDYQYGVNMTFGPRGESGQSAIGFETLRRFADPTQGGLDLLRLAIETRKNQMAAQSWAIRGRDKHNDGGARARKLEAILRRPDGVLTFRTWMRSLLEDHYVLDASTIYYGSSTPERPLLEIMDGGTIKLLVDQGGRTPAPPLPAYQQFLHGMVANDYTRNEIGYYLFNPRPNRIYGMSHVEQVVGIIAIALNRQLSVLDYYTAGTVPDVFIQVPESWTSDQIKLAQTWFDATLEGQTAERRKARFVPGGSEITFAKDQILKNEFDEWLARIICYAMSLSPETLVKQTNRATADTAKESAQEEGLEPEKLWFKDVMDDALERMGAPELEWQWKDEEIADPLTKSKVIGQYVGNKPIVTIEEARELAGLPPATPEALEEIRAMGVVVNPLLDEDETDVDDEKNKKKADTSDAESAAKLAKRRGRSLRPLKRAVRARRRTLKAVRALVAAVFAADRDALTSALRTEAAKVQKLDASDILRALDNLPSVPWTAKTRAELLEALGTLAGNRSAAAMAQLKKLVDQANYEALLTQANEKAVSWANERLGNLITNVDATTRDEINKLTAAAIEQGLTNDELADQLEDAYAFSDARAEMIARTETAEADTQGTLIGYKESGVVEKKQWFADDEACDACAAVDEEIVGLEASFSNGVTGPPGHPNCECFVAPVLAETPSA